MGEEEGKPSSSWNARRHFIVLAALGGTVVATAVVIAISVVLQPPHVEFAVERATRSNTTVQGNNAGMYLKLTVTARSTSGQGRRARMKYRRLFVDLVARSRDHGKQQTYRVPLETPLPGTVVYLPAGAGTPATSMNASLLMVGDVLTKSFLALQVMRTGNVTVVVTAQVRFRIGVVYTRVYDIVVRCPRVIFLPCVNDTAVPPVNCTG